MKLIRRSEIIDFMRCRKVWDYRWQQNLEPVRPDGKLFFGNLFHKFTETYYDGFDHPLAFAKMQDMFYGADTSRMEQTELDDLWDMVVNITTNYVQQWRHIDRTWKVIATELTFAIPLDGDLYYTGTIDLIFKDADGKLFFADHKTASSIERYISKVEMDTQISCYWWALEQLKRGNGYILQGENWVSISSREGKPWQYKFDVEPSGFIYNIILKDYPEPPELLKKGGLSKAKSQKTTFAVYRQALDTHGITEWIDGEPYVPADYKEILQHLKDQETEQGNRYFRRILVTRNEHQIQTAMNEILDAAEDTCAAPKIYRNPTHDCSWCNYRSLCLAEMDGINADLVRNTLYKQKE